MEKVLTLLTPSVQIFTVVIFFGFLHVFKKKLYVCNFWLFCSFCTMLRVFAHIFLCTFFRFKFMSVLFCKFFPSLYRPYTSSDCDVLDCAREGACLGEGGETGGNG